MSSSGEQRSWDDGDFEEFLTDTLETATEDSCPHPGYLQGMCIRCGADRPEDGEELLSFKYVHSGLELSREEASRLSRHRTAEAEAAGKLQLVLDLDHTLLHSVPLEPYLRHPYVIDWMKAEDAAVAEGHVRSLHPVSVCSSLTKLRPGVHAFLSRLTPLYEMHIYTMGEATYASEMAKLLDPRLFRRKVISRDHSSTPLTKNLDVVIGDEKSTVIVDDTWQVWTHHSTNLVKARKYIFFDGLLDQLADESASTGELSIIGTALESVHRHYFALPCRDRDVRMVLSSLFGSKDG